MKLTTFPYCFFFVMAFVKGFTQVPPGYLHNRMDILAFTDYDEIVTIDNNLFFSTVNQGKNPGVIYKIRNNQLMDSLELNTVLPAAKGIRKGAVIIRENNHLISFTVDAATDSTHIIKCVLDTSLQLLSMTYFSSPGYQYIFPQKCILHNDGSFVISGVGWANDEPGSTYPAVYHYKNGNQLQWQLLKSIDSTTPNFKYGFFTSLCYLPQTNEYLFTTNDFRVVLANHDISSFRYYHHGADYHLMFDPNSAQLLDNKILLAAWTIDGTRASNYASLLLFNSSQDF